MSSNSIGKAVLISPLVAPVLYFLGVVAFAKTGGTIESTYVAFGWIMSFGVPISYLATGLVGVPFFRLLEKRKILNMAYLVLSGAILGGTVLLLFTASLTGVEGLQWEEARSSFGIGMVLGTAVAFTFGKIAGITNKDRLCERSEPRSYPVVGRARPTDSRPYI